jgi:isoleucyl-tRNA synthetase
MFLAQQISSMALSLRRASLIKVRQPLQKMMIPIVEDSYEQKINSVKNIILSEVNIKELVFLKDTTGIVTKSVKANFKVLGKKLGKNMKIVSQFLAELTQDEIGKLEKSGFVDINTEESIIKITIDEVEILSTDMPGWLVATEGKITIALDITITEELKEEGLARELINKIQNFRKDNNFEVTDKIIISINCNEELKKAIKNYNDYISTQTLTEQILFDEQKDNYTELDINGIITYVKIDKK